PTASKRFLMVLVDSSMAMMPLPAATMAWAVSASWSMLMGRFRGCGWEPGIIPACAGPGPEPRPSGPLPQPQRSRAPGSELAQALGLAAGADLEQAQGVGGAVQFHGIAAGQDDPV